MHDVWEMVTPVVALLGLLVGNLLTRSTEYRRWLRVERHRACTQLLDAAESAMTDAAFHQAAATSLPELLEDSFEQFGRALATRRGRLFLRPLAWVVTRRLVRAMSPEAKGKEVDRSLAGVLDAVAARSKPQVGDFLSERLGLGENGRLTHAREAAHRTSLAVEAVELICPDKVVDAGKALVDAALQLLLRESDVAASWDDRLAAYKTCRDRFVQSARRDLVRERKIQRRPSRDLSRGGITGKTPG